MHKRYLKNQRVIFNHALGLNLRFAFSNKSVETLPSNFFSFSAVSNIYL